MKVLQFFLLLVAISGIDFLHAEDTTELIEYSKAVFKGGKSFTDDEINSVAEHRNWSEQHKIILQVQMLASADDVSRYRKAIDLSTVYINSGGVEWVQSYLRMQRGFLYNLSGDRETGNSQLEELVDSNAFANFQSIQDPILECMRIRQKNLSTYFGDVMKMSIGHHYLDFRKAGILPEKAYYYFNSINSSGLREECLKQLQLRLGDAYDAVKKNAESIQDTIHYKNNPTSSRNSPFVREPRRNTQQSKDGYTGHLESLGSKEFPWTTFGLIILSVLGVGIAAYWARRSA